MDNRKINEIKCKSRFPFVRNKIVLKEELKYYPYAFKQIIFVHVSYLNSYFMTWINAIVSIVFSSFLVLVHSKMIFQQQQKINVV